MVHQPSEQARFWSGAFGDEYSRRCDRASLVDSNTAFFQHVLAGETSVESVLEFGPNVGLNLAALRRLYPRVRCEAVEVNSGAAEQCRRNIRESRVHCATIASALEEGVLSRAELVLMKGVLIHLAPSELGLVYRGIAELAPRLIVIAEYYNPVPVEIEYRGHRDRLFKRDFAGEFLDATNGYSIVRTGFAYHRDPVAPQDDLTWFLLQRHTG